MGIVLVMGRSSTGEPGEHRPRDPLLSNRPCFEHQLFAPLLMKVRDRVRPVAKTKNSLENFGSSEGYERSA